MPAGVSSMRADAAVHRGIVVLASGRHFDDLRFDILRDLANLFDVVSGAGELIQRADRSMISREDDPEIPAPAGASELVESSMPIVGPEEPNNVSEQGQLVFLRGPQRARNESNTSSAF